MIHILNQRDSGSDLVPKSFACAQSHQLCVEIEKFLFDAIYDTIKNRKLV